MNVRPVCFDCGGVAEYVCAEGVTLCCDCSGGGRECPECGAQIEPIIYPDA